MTTQLIRVKYSLSTKAPILRSKLGRAPSCCQTTLCKSRAIQSPVLLCFAEVPGDCSDSPLHYKGPSHIFCRNTCPECHYRNMNLFLFDQST